MAHNLVGGALYRQVPTSLMGIDHPGGEQIHLGILPQEDGSRLTGLPRPPEAPTHRNSPFYHPDAYSSGHVRVGQGGNFVQAPPLPSQSSASASPVKRNEIAPHPPAETMSGMGLLFGLIGLLAVIKVFSSK